MNVNKTGRPSEERRQPLPLDVDVFVSIGASEAINVPTPSRDVTVGGDVAETREGGEKKTDL